MSKLILSKPILIDGTTVKEINYDLDELTGNVMEESMKAMQKKGYVPAVQEVDPILHAHIFAEAAGIDYEDVKRLSAKDYMKAVGKVRDFFLQDSADSQEETM